MAKKNDKNIIFWIFAAAVLLFAFKPPTKTGTVSVSNPVPEKSPDADFLVTLRDGTKLLASDMQYVYKITSGTVLADGWLSSSQSNYEVVRLFGDSNKYYVSIDDIVSTS